MIENSTFANNVVAAASCEPTFPPSGFGGQDNYDQLHNPQTAFDKVQITSLISIQNS